MSDLIVEETENPQQSSVHATAVVLGEAGVLIWGSSGSGKSRLAFALIEAAEHAALFARLIGDDRIGVELKAGRLIARGHPLILGKIESRGQGILEVPFLPAAVLRLVVDLTGAELAIPRYPEPDQVTVAGANLPRLTLRQDAAASDLARAVLASLRQRHQLTLLSRFR